MKGRTYTVQGTDGRDHHPHAFSIWLADVHGHAVKEIIA